ncbi:TrkA protein [Bacteroidales bacterium KA00251]|nr:TrkA protein [Bacteroidales bacterium KA00251]
MFLLEMDWLSNLFIGTGVGHSIMLVALTITIGLLLAKVKIAGVSLGVTFILFAGIVFAEMGMKIHPDVVHFFQEFGLILFVFSIGMQVGPSFFENFRSGGAQLNMLAVAIVLLGVGVTIGLKFLTGESMSTMVGIMQGAITNTPGLGAAQQTFNDLYGEGDPSIGQGYAVAYPLGVLGIIISIMLIRFLFKVSIPKEATKHNGEMQDGEMTPTPLSLEVKNPSIFGKTVQQLSELLTGQHFVVSRIYKKGKNEIETVGPETILEEDDKIFVITQEDSHEAVEAMVGNVIQMDRTQWIPNRSNFSAHRFVVSKEKLTGKTISQLNLRALYGVTITRIERAGLEFVASPDFRIQFGDTLVVVGSDPALQNVEKVLGNAERHLNHPNLIAIFLGIVLGIILGSIPIPIPGVPQPIKLGLAGGPLIVAILLSRFGYRYGLITYTTTSANLMLREIGICIFLACVGLNAGNGFIDTIVNGGYWWILYGFIITIVPLIIVGIFARAVLKINYLTLAGMMSGSTTDPPALAYANSLSDCSAAQVGYATVYPLTMFMRVLMAQLLILFFT